MHHKPFTLIHPYDKSSSGNPEYSKNHSIHSTPEVLQLGLYTIKCRNEESTIWNVTVYKRNQIFL